VTIQTAAAASKRWPAIVTNVHDGDTIDATILLGLAPAGRDTDYGFHVYRETHDGHAWLVLHGSIRLLGCNARELAMPGGVEARDNLAALLPVGSTVTLATASPDKFGGRYDAAIFLPDGSDLVAQLITGQWAAAWDGTGAKPVPPWPRTV